MEKLNSDNAVIYDLALKSNHHLYFEPFPNMLNDIIVTVNVIT